MRRLIASELVGDQRPRYPALLGQQVTEEPLGGLGIPARLDQDVEDVAVLVDGPPQVVTTAVDGQEHLVEVPLVAGSGLAAAQAGRVDGSELGNAGKSFQPQQIVITHANLPTITHCYAQLLDIIHSRNLQTVTLNDVFG